MIDLYGLAILRNGLKYDYPFKESFLSLSSLVKKTFLALGKSSDGTKEAVLALCLPFEITETIWDDNLRQEGLILSQQTNIALEQLRKNVDLKNTWGFYLQCDEVLHPADYKLILKDINKAQEEGFDAVSFRYLHFWERHHQVAINKKWYPHEIRAIKLDSSIESWGDAQSFRNCKKVYFSDARIFHYGHVREKESYLIKKRDILKHYHKDEMISKYQKREKKFDNMTEVLNYFGEHPPVMKERILRLGDEWTYPVKENVTIVAEKEIGELILKNFKHKINAKNIILKDSLKGLSPKEKKEAIILSPRVLDKLCYPSKVPLKMKSKLARPWPLDTYLTFKLSEKEVSLKV